MQSLPARLAWRLNYKADVQGCTCSFTAQQAIVALQLLVLLPSTLINFILDGDELLHGADMQVGSHMGLLELICKLVHIWAYWSLCCRTLLEAEWKFSCACVEAFRQASSQ